MKSTIAVVSVPVALTLIVFFASTRALPLSGDEPHYLIMADSIASDFDLDLHNNYLNDFNTHRIIGLTIPHVYNVERGWMPGHEPVLSMLIALPFKIGGVTGARVLDEDRPASTWALFWLTAGLFPWLHAKFTITAAILACAAAGALWRRHWGAPGRPTHALAAAALVIVGPAALLVTSNTWASGSPLGFRRANELTTSFARGAEIFLGLHLDQSQGIFVQQPLLLAGAVALPMVAKRQRGLAMLWGPCLSVADSAERARRGSLKEEV
jgi:hypothetical protein